MPTIEEIKEWQATVGAKADGNFGPASLAATIAWARDHGYVSPPMVTDNARGDVVRIAMAELGEQDPHKYYATAAPIYMGTKPNDKSWCGVFALWCLRQAGLTQAVWKDGVGFVGPLKMPTVSLPQKGDVAYFSKNQHYAIVAECASGQVYTIDGNGMIAPKEGVVAHDGIGRNPPPRKIVDVTAFYSIRNLVAAAPR